MESWLLPTVRVEAGFASFALGMRVPGDASAPPGSAALST